MIYFRQCYWLILEKKTHEKHTRTNLNHHNLTGLYNRLMYCTCIKCYTTSLIMFACHYNFSPFWRCNVPLMNGIHIVSNLEGGADGSQQKCSKDQELRLGMVYSHDILSVWFSLVSFAPLRLATYEDNSSMQCAFQKDIVR